MNYCYVITEGIHDREFLARLFKESLGLSRITKHSFVSKFWDKLIPKTFPIDDDLLKRPPVPLFIQNDQYSIALHNVGGISEIVNTLEESLMFIDQSTLHSIGLILDADKTETPSQRFQDLTQELSSKKQLDWIDFLSLKLGQVSKMGNPRFGVFILPDNQNQGTLESILMKCAETKYPDLLKSATKYIEEVDQTKLTTKDLKDFKKPSGKNKAIISTISSVLRPGKAIQNSIQDNQWINKESLQLPSMILIKQFIDDLIC